jgi:hypothetical protein
MSVCDSVRNFVDRQPINLCQGEGWGLVAHRESIQHNRLRNNRLVGSADSCGERLVVWALGTMALVEAADAAQAEAEDRDAAEEDRSDETTGRQVNSGSIFHRAASLASVLLSITRGARSALLRVSPAVSRTRDADDFAVLYSGVASYGHLTAGLAHYGLERMRSILPISHRQTMLAAILQPPEQTRPRSPLPVQSLQDRAV